MFDEKKKIAIVAALGVVILGIGAFQFMPGGAKPNKPSAKHKLTASTAPVVTTPAIPLDPPTLPPRDPFQPPADAADTQPKQAPASNFHKDDRSAAQLEAQSQPRRASKWRPQEPQMEGDIQPLPIATQNGSADSSFHTSAGATKQPAEPTFDYQLVGVVLGAHPVAVLADKSGAQHLVGQGAAIDGDSELDAVKPGEVMVRFRGKKLRVVMGGVSVGK